MGPHARAPAHPAARAYRRLRRRQHRVGGHRPACSGLGKPLVVVERAPDPAMIERARDQGFDLLTGDASRDDTLDLCNLGAAHSLVALTNVDTLNLEIALGGRVRNPDMPIVLRIADASFAASIARHFQFETTFSAEALAAPTFAGLSRLPGARGRIVIAGEEFGIGEMVLPENYRALVPDGAFPIGVWRGDLVAGAICRCVPGRNRVVADRPSRGARASGATFAAIAERLQNGSAISPPLGEPVEPGQN